MLTCKKCSRANPAQATYCYYDGVASERRARRRGAATPDLHRTVHVSHRGWLAGTSTSSAWPARRTGPRRWSCSSRGISRNSSGPGPGRPGAWPPAKRPASPTRTAASTSSWPGCPARRVKAPTAPGRADRHQPGHAPGRRGPQARAQPGKPGHAAALRLGHRAGRALAHRRRQARRAAEALPVRQRADHPGQRHRQAAPGQQQAAGRQADHRIERRQLRHPRQGRGAGQAVPGRRAGRAPAARGRSPRRPRRNPKEAALLFEKGAVAQWYKDNGWTYPVRGPAASGLGAVQQFFEALGLTPPPKVAVSDKQVNLQAEPGQTVQHSLEVQVGGETARLRPRHQRPALAGSRPGPARTAGSPPSRCASPTCPTRSGETLHAKLTVTSNGNQRFVDPGHAPDRPGASIFAAGRRRRARRGRSSPAPAAPSHSTRLTCCRPSCWPAPACWSSSGTCYATTRPRWWRATWSARPATPR